MRVSQFEGDDGFDVLIAAQERGERIIVKLDGVEVQDWHHADDGADRPDGRGLVGSPKKNADGSLWLSADGYMRTVNVAGVVEILSEPS